MPLQDHAHEKYGIDEIYIYQSFTYPLLEKLHQRAVFSLDWEDPIIQKQAFHDMVLVFRNQIASQSLIYRFLKFLNQEVGKQDFIKAHTLINEEEFFPAIKEKKFVLVTHQRLLKKLHIPLVH